VVWPVTFITIPTASGSAAAAGVIVDKPASNAAKRLRGMYITKSPLADRLAVICKHSGPRPPERHGLYHDDAPRGRGMAPTPFAFPLTAGMKPQSALQNARLDIDNISNINVLITNSPSDPAAEFAAVGRGMSAEFDIMDSCLCIYHTLSYYIIAMTTPSWYVGYRPGLRKEASAPRMIKERCAGAPAATSPALGAGPILGIRETSASQRRRR